jgi:NAD(P)-dependent dehydrogenase (short-subunit alcohol dehydrogenase family)
MALFSRGAEVILHGRTTRKGRGVQQELKEKTGGGKPDLLIADVSDQDQIRQMAADVSSCYAGLDVLINNAGTFEKVRRLTRDGVEMTFAVNYLAPFLLTLLLLPLLRKSTPSRIVTVASIAHQDVNRIDWDNLQGEHHYEAWDAYALSKFADIAFTYTLARQIDGTGVTANCLHPGVTSTKILKTAFPDYPGIPPEKGACTSVYLAFSPEVAGVSGRYFEDQKPVRSSELTYDLSVQERLWDVARELTGID